MADAAAASITYTQLDALLDPLVNAVDAAAVFDAAGFRGRGPGAHLGR